MKTIYLVAACLLLAACGAKERPAFIGPAKDKLVCPAEPGRPVGLGGGGAVTDEEAAQYMKALRSAGQGCRDRVNWMRTWVETMSKSK